MPIKILRSRRRLCRQAKRTTIQYRRKDRKVLRSKTNDYGTGIPQHEMEALARILLPEIVKFYESAEGQASFEKWKAEQDAKKSEDIQDN